MNSKTTTISRKSLKTRSRARQLGATLAEYALLLFLVMIAAYVTYKSLGTKISDTAKTAEDKLK
jgi:Flp pilus assembly pilin Flp